jgi:hypothetical protein
MRTKEKATGRRVCQSKAPSKLNSNGCAQQQYHSHPSIQEKNNSIEDTNNDRSA